MTFWIGILLHYSRSTIIDYYNKKSPVIVEVYDSDFMQSIEAVILYEYCCYNQYLRLILLLDFHTIQNKSKRRK